MKKELIQCLGCGRMVKEEQLGEINKVQVQICYECLNQYRGREVINNDKKDFAFFDKEGD